MSELTNDMKALLEGAYIAARSTTFSMNHDGNEFVAQQRSTRRAQLAAVEIPGGGNRVLAAFGWFHRITNHQLWGGFALVLLLILLGWIAWYFNWFWWQPPKPGETLPR